MKSKVKFVVVYDNGSGYEEWACSPQNSAKEALEASNIPASGQFFAGSNPTVKKIEE